MKYLKWFFCVLGLLLVCFVLLTYLSTSNISKTSSTCQILEGMNVDSIDFKKHDSVLISASTLYESNMLKDVMQGEQYREAWSTPFKFPVAFLDTLKGGMTILEEGGGKQTHSLKAKSINGEIYSLRSINKDPDALIPEFAKTLGIENIVVDGISAQHPYAAPVVAKLADRAKILHTEPRAVFLPKQDRLNSYNSKYGNRIYLLEHETDGGANWTPLNDVIQITDTEGLQKLKMKYADLLSIDERALVRARLFDILIGDWDRHSKQWGWVVNKRDNQYVATPLPGDRDNAFFNIGGIIPTLLSNKNVLPGLQSFEKDVDYLPGLVMAFDRYFLKTVSPQIFEDEAKALQGLLNDQSIRDSFSVWPKEIADLDAKDIQETILARRNSLVQIANQFRQILDEQEFLSEPLKGSEDLDLTKALLNCFDCE